MLQTVRLYQEQFYQSLNECLSQALLDYLYPIGEVTIPDNYLENSSASTVNIRTHQCKFPVLNYLWFLTYLSFTEKCLEANFSHISDSRQAGNLCANGSIRWFNTGVPSPPVSLHLYWSSKTGFATSFYVVSPTKLQWYCQTESRISIQFKSRQVTNRRCLYTWLIYLRYL